MRLWRCVNAKCWDEGKQGHDFTSEGPVGQCDKCGVRSDDKRFGSVIVPRVVIHYHPPSGVVEHIGTGSTACRPGEPAHKYRSSGAPTAVNCPLCMETDVFKANLAEISLHPDYDVPMSQLGAVKGITTKE